MLEMVWIVACSVNSDQNREQLENENLLKENDKQHKQVKCGAVYVTEEDKTKTVTKNVISLSSSSEDKKKKSSKYTLAVGSSFGHIHSFLKDSEYVLKTYEDIKAEDKCLLLIRKPKSASKQMLKAHSWANLSSPDMHMRQPDGSLKPDRYKPFKNRNKPSNLSQPIPSNQSVPFKVPTLPLSSKNSFCKGPSLSNESTTFKELQTLHEYDEETKSDILPRKNSSEQVSNLVNSYRYERQSSGLKQQISRSSSALNESSEKLKIMGGIISQSRGKSKGRAPPVPQRSTQSPNTDNNDVLQRQKCGPVCTKLDVLLHADAPTSENTKKTRDSRDMKSARGKNGSQILQGQHSSGFNSEMQLSNDELYDFGFIKELNKPTVNGTQLTSSPKTVRKCTNQNGNRHSVDINNENVIQTSPNHCSGVGQPVSHVKVGTLPGPQPINYDSKVHSANNGFELSSSHNKLYSDKSIQRLNRNPDYAKGDKGSAEQIQQQPLTNYSNIQKVVHIPKGVEHLSYSGYHGNCKERKSVADIQFEKSPGFDKESVIRAQSLGDLNTGLALVVAEQKSSDSSACGRLTEFTGTQLMQHIRTYRDMQKSESGSLPFKSKPLDHNTYTKYGQSVQSITQNTQQANSEQQIKSKPKYHGSLQHLPFESNPDHQKPIGQCVKTPIKPHRCLPQPPSDVQEKQKVVSEIVKSRLSMSSHSSTCTGSSNSNRPESNEPRHGGISATPSDYEVSALLNGNKNDVMSVTSVSTNVCNTYNGKNNTNVKTALTVQPESLYDGSFTSISKSGSFGAHDQNQTIPPGGRFSESGQTTLTSQSTIDSGYVTNECDPYMLTTSSYAKTLKKSAQSMYSSSKLLKQTNGDNFTQQDVNGDISNQKSQSYSQLQQAKDTHTRTWLENHPGSFMDVPLKLDLQVVSISEVTQEHVAQDIDKNNNKSRLEQKCNKEITELDLTNKDCTLDKQDNYQRNVKLPHHVSEMSAMENEKPNRMESFTRPKGKSMSMAQGLNLIERSPSNKYSVSHSQLKFTGSLKDLLGINKEMVPIDTLKRNSTSSSSTLPGSWRFQGQGQLDSSLTLLGMPSLFQLLQNYNLMALHAKIPDNFSIIDNIRLIDCEVVLPSWSSVQEISSPLSPKGSYAKLGGPDSAFRPVSSGGTTVKSVSMVTVMEISSQMLELFEECQLQKGDLIIELNEILLMGENLSTLTSVLKCVKGDLLLTIARDKARVSRQHCDRMSSMPNDEDFRRMEQKINELMMELRKKDRTLKQLNALLPWKQTGATDSNTDRKDQELCSLSDDEFIV